MRFLKRVTLHSILVSALITLSMAAMTLGACPVEAAPFAYVTHVNSSTVSVINTASNKVMATIPVDGAPSCVAITPNGEFAYVTNSSTNGVVWVIATPRKKVAARISVEGIAPTGVAITPMGNSPT